MRRCALAALMLLGVSSDSVFARNSRLISFDSTGRQGPVAHESTAVQFPESTNSALRLGKPTAASLGAFNITISPGASLAGNALALAAFNRAAAQWDAFFADPITVTIQADLAPLGPGVLGSASAVVLAGSYTEVRNAVVADALDEADDLIATLLPTSSTATFFVPTGFALDGDVQVTKANAKALGFTGLDAAFGASDGDITFSSTFAFDYDNSNGVTPGTYDFETVAAHEIGHALGFISDVDYIDSVLNASQVAANVEPTTLDLFRFQKSVAGDPLTIADFTARPRSLVPGANEMFDQILTTFGGDAEVRFSTGDTQGDGQQASHWKDLLGLGIMDPTLAPGVISPITPNDLRAFDLIGYEIQAHTPVPEPAGFTIVLLLLPAASLGRRRAKMFL
jgi:hypothetical protein